MSNQILNRVVQYMSNLGKTDLTGPQKKQILLLWIADELDLPEILEDFIIEIIDLLIQTEQGKIIFNKKAKKSILSCFNR